MGEAYLKSQHIIKEEIKIQNTSVYKKNSSTLKKYEKCKMNSIFSTIE